MLRIFIDANQRKNKIVALQKVDGDQISAITKKEGDIDLVTAIKEICQEQKLKLEQIDDFVYAQGGASFTGIKMAAAVANILKWSVKKTPFDQLPMPEYDSEPNITLPNP